MKRKFWFLTKLSLKKKIGTKWFIGAQALMLIVMIGLFNINHIITFFGGDFNDETTIFVVDNTGHSFNLFEENFNQLYETVGELRNLNIEQAHNLDELKEEIINTSNIIVQVQGDEQNFIRAYIFTDSGIDSITFQLISNSLNTTKSIIALQLLDISPDDLERLYAPAEIAQIALNEDIDTEDNRAATLGFIATVVGLPIFMISLYLISMIGAEINEEKSTRSMEIIVSNVSPKTHFFSKILSVNIFALLQSLLLVFYGVLAILVGSIISEADLVGNLGGQINDIWETLGVGSLAIPLWQIIPLILLMLIFTFIAYSLVAGILASMTTNMEDFQQLQTPVIMVSLAGYYFALAASAFEGSVFIESASYIPFISAILAPALLAAGYTTVIQFLISIIILLVFCFILIKYGLRIYKVGILNYSSDKLWTKIFKAAKEDV